MAVYIPQDFRAPFFRKNWVRFVNSAGETIPSHAIMRVTNCTVTNGEMIYTVAKPDGTYRWRYLVNSCIAVGSGSAHEGWGTFLDEGGPAYYSSGTPALNEMWGPTSGQWYLTQHRPGFLISGAGTSTSGGVNVLFTKQVVPGEIRVYNDSGGAVAASASATMSVYGGSAGTTDTSMDVTLTNASTTSWATSKYGSATIDMGGLIFGVPLQV